MTTAPDIPASVWISITDRLVAAIGVDPAVLESGRLRWIVAARCRELGLADATAYAQHLEASPPELDALIDEVVVQETRFFRDPQVFDHIRLAMAQLAANFPGPLRILSAPCGTGQEAWSLAATMSQLGLPPSRYTIDAFDISLAALAVAQTATYPDQAMRLVPLDLQRLTATQSHRQWTILAELRGRVQFERRNLASPQAFGPGAQYHLILCRNLFIYLGAKARVALAESLATALVPGGRLVLGTADRVDELTAVFAPLRPAGSFAYVHRATAPTYHGKAVMSGFAATDAKGVPQRLQPRFAVGGVDGTAEAVSLSRTAVPLASETLHKSAVQHQLRGDLRQAERLCRQSLYLAPDYLPALELLQTLWQQQPNLRLRRALKDRILRTRLTQPTWKELV